MVNGVDDSGEFDARIACIVAPNASPMTLEGTNSYLIDAGDGRAVVIDPGPAIPRHIDALVGAASARDTSIAAIFVTHGHPDHAPGARLLKERTGASVFAHRSARFPHDVAMTADPERGGETIVIGSVWLAAVHVPGHAVDHLAFYDPLEHALFTGDVVIGRGTVAIAPPHGDMRAYQRSLHLLRERFPHAATIRGGHGPRVDDPLGKLEEYIAHRQRREAEVVAHLERGAATIPDLVAAIYAATPQVLWPAAARQILAYLIALEREGRVREDVLPRAPDAREAAILMPDLSRIADPELAAVAAAELGYESAATSISRYALA